MSGSSCGAFEVDDAALTGLSQTWANGGAELAAVAREAAALLARVRGAADDGGAAPQFAATESIAVLVRAQQSAAALAGALGQDAQGMTQCLLAYREAEKCVKQRIDDVTGGPGRSANPGTTSPPNSPPKPTPGPDAGRQPADQGQVKGWIDEAFGVLEANGVPAWELDGPGVAMIIEHESSGNPGAVNDWDSNAQAGHASKGLMQCIDTTFEEFKLPGHDDIFDPVDNIIAGVRYALSRYGSISNVPGVRSVAEGGQYVGY